MQPGTIDQQHGADYQDVNDADYYDDDDCRTDLGQEVERRTTAAQSRRTTPPVCSGRARTTAGDLPPPQGALCLRKGYPSGKDERLASHPGELRRVSA